MKCGAFKIGKNCSLNRIIIMLELPVEAAETLTAMSFYKYT